MVGARRRVGGTSGCMTSRTSAAQCLESRDDTRYAVVVTEFFGAMSAASVSCCATAILRPGEAVDEVREVSGAHVSVYCNRAGG